MLDGGLSSLQHNMGTIWQEAIMKSFSTVLLDAEETSPLSFVREVEPVKGDHNDPLRSPDDDSDDGPVLL
ncbi:unnamed protein product [Haemonchus placei]|uniref:Uncharacterized protein n=1 Tax=Haemonchus placei TaxID=6290 RepID=A0A0N4WGG6_HAEPC|nr:unnamed protein product [Haemonchus placei]